MYGIVVAAINSALVFIFRSVVLKTIVFFSLYYVVSSFVSYLSDKLPTVSNIDTLFNNMPDFFMYFFQVFECSTGFSLLLSAWILRFMIRRIPVIG